MKILLHWFATDAEIARIRSVLPKDGEILTPKPRAFLSRYEVEYDDVSELASEADVIMGWTIPPGILERAKNLKALIYFHAGIDDLDIEQLKHRKIEISNCRGANSVAVAEYAMALMLGIAKRVLPNHQDVIDAHWEPPGEQGRQERRGAMLSNKTVAIIGFGQIGTAIATRAKGFNMKVIAVRKHPERGAEGIADAVFGTDELLTVLNLADYTILAMPITSETRAIIDQDAINAMKPTSFLINIARGNLIKELPLYEALKNWRISGFATDCWWNYEKSNPGTYHFPVPSRTNLQRLPNVLGAGSQAGAGVWEIKNDYLQEYGVEALSAFVQGKSMPRKVNLKLEY
jgi:phosphoglycerate dehydrogenase-like enzyme